MASSSNKKNNQSTPFKAERPHFFKVILDDTIHEKKLGIPRKFVRNYGHHLSSHVMLKMPSGLKWKVEVVKTVGAIWLQNGWPEFVEHYSIVCGSFLVFEYDKKNGDFDVAIFDKTTTEMDYLISDRLPRFFKIVLNDSIPQQKLRIPGKFVRNYGHWMSNRVMLKVPSGANWQVEIVRSEGQIWLQNGWREFADYYSVRYSSFLVFDYEKKNGDFNVTIFDRTATEIDYPLSFSDADKERANLHEPNIIDEVEEDVFIEILDHLSRSRKTKAAKSPTSLPSRSNKKMKPESMSAKKRTGGQVEGSSSKGLPKCSFSHHPEAETLTSANQSFQAEISSNNLKYGTLYLPKQYCIKNIKQGTKETIIRLKVNNRWWSVKLIIHFGGGVLSAGLLKFARENSLKVGDVCIFGSINNSDPTQLVNVSIIRDKKNAESQVPKVKGTRTGIPVEISRKRKEKSPLSSSQANKKMKQAENFSKITGSGPYGKLPENRSFQITMSPSYIHPGKTNLQIPADFSRKYLKRENGDALLKVLGGRTWTVKYYTAIRTSGCTTTWVKRAGWKVFAQENHLEVGDVCKFELIDNNKTLLKVVICRRTTRTNAGKGMPKGAAQGIQSSKWQ